MKNIIYDINFDNFNISTETLDQFLNIDNLHNRDIRFLCSSTRFSYFAIRDKIIVLKLTLLNLLSLILIFILLKILMIIKFLLILENKMIKLL